MNDTLEIAQQHIKKDLPKHDPASVKIEWAGKIFRLEGNQNNNVVLPIDIRYRALKNDDTPYKNITRTGTSMAMNYCPFCGEKFE
ncbi:hypothetical protein [Amphritea atlantica]|nr:hypothetical protein [Amphritea atlantica]